MNLVNINDPFDFSGSFSIFSTTNHDPLRWKQPLYLAHVSDVAGLAQFGVPEWYGLTCPSLYSFIYLWILVWDWKWMEPISTVLIFFRRLTQAFSWVVAEGKAPWAPKHWMQYSVIMFVTFISQSKLLGQPNLKGKEIHSPFLMAKLCGCFIAINYSIIYFLWVLQSRRFFIISPEHVLYFPVQPRINPLSFINHLISSIVVITEFGWREKYNCTHSKNFHLLAWKKKFPCVKQHLWIPGALTWIYLGTLLIIS